MPFIVPIAAAIGSAIASAAPVIEGIAAATSLASGITSMVRGGQGGGASNATQQQIADAQYKQQVSDNAKARQQEQAAIARQYPNLQEDLGGAVAPDYLLHQASTQAGFPGDTNVGASAWQQFLGDKSLTNLNTFLTPQSNPTQGFNAGGSNFWDSFQPQMGSNELQASGGSS